MYPQIKEYVLDTFCQLKAIKQDKLHTADMNGGDYFTMAADPAKQAHNLTLDGDGDTDESSTSDSKRARSGGNVEEVSTAPRKGKVRIMNDYCCDLSLWGDIDCVQLSHRVEKDLRSLARRFNAYYDQERGWDSAEKAERHREHARSVHRKLVAALPGYEVELDLWEVEQAQAEPPTRDADGGGAGEAAVQPCS